MENPILKWMIWGAHPYIIVLCQQGTQAPGTPYVQASQETD